MYQWFFTIVLAAIPFVYSTILLDPVQSIRFPYLIMLGIVSLVAVWINDEKQLLSRVSRCASVRNLFFISISVLLACTLFSVAIASQKSEAWTEVARVAAFFVFFITTTLFIDTGHRAIISLSTGFCIAGFFFSLFAINDFFHIWNELNDPKSLYEMTGHMGHRNLLAIQLTLCMPFHIIVMQHYHSSIVKTLAALNMLLIATTIGLTTSRVGWMGLSAMFFLAIILIIAGYRRGIIGKQVSQRVLLFSVSCIIAFSSAVAVYLLKNHSTAMNMTQRLTSFINYKKEKNEHTETIRERLRLWSNTVAIIKDHPVTGVGAGNWKFHFPEKGMAGIRSENGMIHFQQPHNDFLWVWAETGLAGWLAFMALFISAFVIAFKKAGAANDIGSFTVISAAACGAGAYFVESVFDFPKERPLPLFTFAVFLAIINSLPDGKEEGKISTIKSRTFLILLMMMGIAVAAFWAFRGYSETHLKKALTARSQGNYNEMFRQLDFIYQPLFEVDLTGTPLDWYRGEAAFYQGRKDAAKGFLENALRIYPAHLYTLSNLGSIYYVEGDTAKAIECWNKALSIAPGYADANLNLAIVYYNEGNISKAVELLARFTIKKEEMRHDNIISTIMSEYIKGLMKYSINPELTDALVRMSANDEWLLNLQDKMASRRETPWVSVWKEAIFTGEMLDEKLSKAVADSLRKYYNLPLD